MIKRMTAAAAVALLGTGLAAGCATQRSVAETQLIGTAERPGPGDPNGGGAAQLVLYRDQGKICFGITVNNITVPATAAHIHRGPFNVAGPVVVALTPPGPDANSAGCATGVNHNLIQAIINNPAAYYVNVHNANYPNGAVRGQLH